MVRTLGFRLCGVYTVGVIAHVLVVACSACAGAMCVHVIKQCIAVCGMHICMDKVTLRGIEFRVQGAGGVQGELVML